MEREREREKRERDRQVEGEIQRREEKKDTLFVFSRDAKNKQRQNKKVKHTFFPLADEEETLPYIMRTIPSNITAMRALILVAYLALTACPMRPTTSSAMVALGRSDVLHQGYLHVSSIVRKRKSAVKTTENPYPPQRHRKRSGSSLST